MPASDYPETAGMDLWLVEGRWSIRTFDRVTQQWTTQPQQLQTAHWYPTQVRRPGIAVLWALLYLLMS